MSKFKGGYITIDVQNGNVTSESDTPVIPGIYQSLIESRGKAVRFINVKFGNVTYDVIIPTIIQYESNAVSFFLATNVWINIIVSEFDGVAATVIE